MLSIQCPKCKNLVEVAFYFSNESIISHTSPILFNEEYYEAIVNGKAICPDCGETINKTFVKKISKKTIIKIAIGEKI